MESKEQLQSLRDKLNGIYAIINPAVGSAALRETITALLQERAEANRESARGVVDSLRSLGFYVTEQRDTADTFQAMAQRHADIVSALADTAVDAGRLDALLSQMQKTDEESAELVGRAERVRERLKAAAV
jgi:predicted  nucleic acid-binding Zn-ribbon protein